MVELSRTRRRLLGGAVASAVTGVTLFSGASAIKRRSGSQSSRIQIKQAALKQVDDRWVFDCRADIDLPSAIRLGLESGVPLQFVVSLKVQKPIRFWRDESLLHAEHRFRLVYYELTRHYRVQSVETKRSFNKRSLLSALDELGNVRMMDVTPWVKDAKSLANTEQARIASVAIELDQQALPLPLQPLFSSDWRLASEEFVWPLS